MTQNDLDDLHGNFEHKTKSKTRRSGSFMINSELPTEKCQSSNPSPDMAERQLTEF